MSEAQRLRDKLRARKAGKAENPPLRFPFILDDALAAEVTKLSGLYEQVESRVEYLREQIAQSDEDGTRDVRASGHDTTGMSDRLVTAEAELARLHRDLDAAVEQVETDRFMLVFAPCGSTEYEALLAQYPSADEDMATNIAFRNALLGKCFVRFEKDGQPLELFASFEEFLEEASLDFGELDPWRTAVVIACNRNPHQGLSR